MTFLDVINGILADEMLRRKELDLSCMGWLAMLFTA